MDALLNSALQHSTWLVLALLFVVILAESTALVGLLIPGTVLMVGLGTLIGNGTIDFWLACGLGFVAALLGDGVSYWLGQRYRHRLMQLKLVQQQRRLLLQAKLILRRHGPVGIFVGRFVGPTRPVLPLVAGMLSMRKQRFFPACVLACALWSPAYFLPGILAGAAFGLDDAGWIAFPWLLAASAALAGVAAWSNWHVVRQIWRRAGWRNWPRRARWLAPVSSTLAALAAWQLWVHPLAGAYFERLWQVIV